MNHGDIILYNHEHWVIESIDVAKFCKLRKEKDKYRIELLHLKDIRNCPVINKKI